MTSRPKSMFWNVFFLFDQGVHFPLALFLLLWGGGGDVKAILF